MEIYSKTNFTNMGGLIIKQIAQLFKKNISNLMIFIIIILLFIYILNSIFLKQIHLENKTFDTVTILTLILTIQELNHYKLETKKNHQHMEKEKATEMVKYYQEEIMPLMSIIFNNKINQKELLEPFERQKLKFFNYDEFFKYLKRSNISVEDYQLNHNKSYNNPIFLKSYLEHLCRVNNDNYYDNLLDHICYYITHTDKAENQIIINPVAFKYDKLADDLVKKELSKINEEDLNEDKMKEVINKIEKSMNYKINKDLKDVLNKSIYLYLKDQENLLNKIEYFSMCFVSKVADENVAYQSLHQTFIKTIEYLYPNIAMINRDPKSKYYTNTIELYNLWKNRYLEYEKKENESFEIEQNKKNSLQHIYEKKETS